MKQKIQLSESQLRNLIKESVLAELDKRKVMPSKYYEIFKNRVINASHGRLGDVDKAVIEFYKDFKKRVPNEGFTIDNLMELADNIENGGDRTHERGGTIGGHKIKDADGWWGANMGKFLEEKKVRLTESQLHKLIKESVMKALVKEWRELTASEKEWRDIEREREDKKCAKENDDAVEKSKFAKKMLGKKSGELDEISVDMMRNARDKFGDTYGPNLIDDTSNPMGPKDHQFYPKKIHYKPTKDGKDFSVHMNNFNDAIAKSEMEEIKNLGDEELTKRAEQIWNRYSKDADFEEYDRDGGEVWGNVILEVDGWEFSTDGSGFGHRDYNLDWEITGDSVEFTAPDGRSGWFSI